MYVHAHYREPQFLDSLVSISNWFQIYVNFDSCVELGLLLQWKVSLFLSVCPVSVSARFLPRQDSTCSSRGSEGVVV